MKASAIKYTAVLAMLAGTAHAAGPLYTTDTNPPVPLKWDMSNGPIPVYTDGGDAFAFDYDGVTPFITVERANEITQFAFDQWNDVATSTFEAQIAGTIESQTGIADVTGANAEQIYFVENGYGFWVNFDTDGSILEEYFGVSRDAVLGIAFPEFSDGNGNIIEATAVLNGWYVSEDDIDGNWVAGVFSHEFGHAINLSHSQVNGPMVYNSYTYAPRYPGVPGCGLDPVYRWDYPPNVAGRADPNWIETMYPFINSIAESGAAQSTVDHPDDQAAISNLYPTGDYLATTGSISGTLRLKDGTTEYSG
ncbi:MAG: matrixin family metalloprotease, partial [Woeseiaceae bacterium]